MEKQEVRVIGHSKQEVKSQVPAYHFGDEQIVK